MSNPLLNLSLNKPIPFATIKPEHIIPALDEIFGRNRELIAKLTRNRPEHSWQSLVVPLEAASDALDNCWNAVSHLNSVMDSAPLREVYSTALARLSAYHTELEQNRGLYDCFKRLQQSPQYQDYDYTQKKVITNTLRDFKLAGVHLAAKDKQSLKAINQSLSKLTDRFGKNVLDATDAWSIVIDHEDHLAGLPEASIATAAQAAKDDNLKGFKFNLKAPAFNAIINYADNAELRFKTYEAYVTRASELGANPQWDNSAGMLEILRRRREQARLLGFDNYAEYSLATKMARSVAELEEFIAKLAAHAKPAAERELKRLRQFAKDKYGATKLNAWDFNYYSEKLRQAQCGVNQESLRPWFELNRVLGGMFAIANRLYGIKVQPTSAPTKLWHKDAQAFEVYDRDGQLRAKFYLDLYARAHKRGGAWMAECVNRRRVDGHTQLPVAFLVCNFAAPLADKPCLLNHDEVLTLFHEFGHGLHHLLTTVDYASISGINGVAWDAVELPSQFMENWCWRREGLDLIALHYQTGEALSSAMLGKILAAKNFQAGLSTLRQLEFALFDLRLHSSFDPDNGGTINTVLDEVRREIAVVTPPPFNRFANGFAHIFSGGYAAAYYSYKWAEVLSADAFASFEAGGVFNQDLGQKFLRTILERGGAKEALELFTEFKGRAPDISALLRQLGLVDEGGA